MSNTTNLIEVFKADRRRWFSLSGSKTKLPEARPDLDFFAVTGPPASLELSLVSRDKALKHLTSNQDAKVLALLRVPADFALSFAGVVKDADGHGWDLLLDGGCSVNDVRDFLVSYGAESVTPEAPVSCALLTSWLASAVQTQVKNAVAERAIADLRDKDALPARWWETQFNKWLSQAGLTFKITSARWESADAARAEAERARELEMRRIAQERDRQLQAELREAKAKTDYEKERSRIEADKLLSESERTHQLQVLELRHRKERLAAETEIENARRAAELAALEHKVAVACLRNKVESANKAEARIAEAQAEEARARLAEAELRKAEEQSDREKGKSLRRKKPSATRCAVPEWKAWAKIQRDVDSGCWSIIRGIVGIIVGIIVGVIGTSVGHTVGGDVGRTYGLLLSGFVILPFWCRSRVSWRNKYRLHCAELCHKAGDYVQGSSYAFAMGRSGVDLATAGAIVVSLAELAEENDDLEQARKLYRHAARYWKNPHGAYRMAELGKGDS